MRRLRSPATALVSLTAGAFAFLLAPIASGDALKRFIFSEPHMGTLVRLTMYAPDRDAADQAAREAFSRIEQLNSIMSDYDPDSELMQLSRQPVGKATRVSEDLFNVLSRAREISKLSRGAFDVTAGAAARLWRESRADRKLPESEVLEKALRTTGYHNLELDPCTGTITLLAPGMQLDLGGIGKGYAAEQALDALRITGLPHSLVAISGDLAIGDPPPGQPGWQVGLASIDADGSEVTETVVLDNRAVSTSGDTEQFVKIGGARYSHIVDPKTGLGLTERIGVTVIARKATSADGLATAISVSGLEDGLALVESLPEVEALIVTITSSGREKIESSGFSRFKR